VKIFNEKLNQTKELKNSKERFSVVGFKYKDTWKYFPDI